MNIKDMLDLIKKKEPQPLTPEIQENIQNIQKACKHYTSSRDIYGEAALIRMFLLDKEIANNLTPEVIKYLFTAPASHGPKIKIYGDEKPLRDIIYQGLEEGLLPIRVLPNNVYHNVSYEFLVFDPDHDTDTAKKAADFTNNTWKIAENIAKAADVPTSELENPDPSKLNTESLTQQFNSIVFSIGLIAANEVLRTRLIASDHRGIDNIRDTERTFASLCQNLSRDLEEKGKSVTLDSVCEEFLSAPKFILNPDDRAFILDRVYIEAALLSSQKINIGGKEYSHQDIYRKMLEKLSEHPDNYPYAKQQVCVRFATVESDLRERFKQQYDFVINQSNFAGKPDAEKVEIAQQLAGVILLSEDKTLQDFIRHYSPELYKEIGKQVKLLYENNIEQPCREHLQLLKDRSEFLTTNQENINLSFRVINNALGQPDRINSEDELTTYRDKIKKVEQTLAQPFEDTDLTGFQILKKDTSDLLTKICRFFENLKNGILGTPKIKHEGQNIAKAIQFKESYLKEINQPKNDPPEKGDAPTIGS